MRMRGREALKIEPPVHDTVEVPSDMVDKGGYGAAAWVRNTLGSEEQVREHRRAVAREKRLKVVETGPTIGLLAHIEHWMTCAVEYLALSTNPGVDADRVRAAWEKLKEKSRLLDAEFENDADSPLVLHALGFPEVKEGSNRAETVAALKKRMRELVYERTGMQEHFGSGDIPDPEALARVAPEIQHALAENEHKKDAKEVPATLEAKSYRNALDLLDALAGHEDKEAYVAAVRTQNSDLWDTIPTFETHVQVETFLRVHAADADFNDKFRRIKEEQEDVWLAVRPSPVLFTAELHMRREKKARNDAVHDLVRQVEEMRKGGVLGLIRRWLS